VSYSATPVSSQLVSKPKTTKIQYLSKNAEVSTMLAFAKRRWPTYTARP
jgi:hypothetical protein